MQPVFVSLSMGGCAMNDKINKPDHYTVGGIETIDYIKAKLTDNQYEGYLLGNCIKYLSRFNYKNNRSDDIKKAKWYINHLADYKEKEKNT